MTEVRPRIVRFVWHHRSQMQDLPHATPTKIAAFKDLCLDATMQVAQGRDGYGLLCDSRLGRNALYRAAGQGLWIGRPVEWPASRPLTLEPEIGADFGGLSEWPLEHIVKVLCYCHPGDAADLQAQQEATLQRLFQASRRNRLELLLEIIPSKVGPVDDNTTARLIQRFYDIGIYPDWWKLEPMQTAAAWEMTVQAIQTRDPHTQGIVILGLGQTEAELAAAFKLAAVHPLVKGFAVGRTIFGDAARDWMAGSLTDAQAVTMMAANYTRMCQYWDNAKGDCN